MLNSYVALDIETTGLNPAKDSIIEVGAIRIENGTVTDMLSTLVNPGYHIPDRITDITGIDDDMVKDAPAIDSLVERIVGITEGLPLLGHNIIFDYSFIKKAAADHSITYERMGIDTYKFAKTVLPDIPSKSLEALCGYFGIDVRHHRAYDDAGSASVIYGKLCEMSCKEIAPVQLVYRLPKREPATPRQKSYLAALIRRYNVSIPCDMDTVTKSDASRMIDRIMSEYGIVRNRTGN